MIRKYFFNLKLTTPVVITNSGRNNYQSDKMAKMKAVNKDRFI